MDCMIPLVLTNYSVNIVYDCSPLLPDLESLVRYLNDTRDFYGFLKKARKAFQEVAKDMPKN